VYYSIKAAKNQCEACIIRGEATPNFLPLTFYLLLSKKELGGNRGFTVKVYNYMRYIIMIVVCRNAKKRFDKPLFMWLWQN